jgi:hypothetical protein
VSTFVLYSYNLYNKAFELAQPQAHVRSTLAKKLNEDIVDKAGVAGQKIMAKYLSAQKADAALQAEFDHLVADIKFLTAVLKSSMKETGEVADTVWPLLQKAVLDFSLSPKRQAIEEFTQELVKQQVRFVAAYQKEIPDLIRAELNEFSEVFNSRLPPLARPEILGLIALGFCVAYVILGFAFRGAKFPALD